MGAEQRAQRSITLPLSPSPLRSRLLSCCVSPESHNLLWATSGLRFLFLHLHPSPVSKNPCRPPTPPPGECSLWSLGQTLPAVCSLGGRRWVEMLREVNVAHRHGSQPPASESVMNLCSKPGPSPYLLSAASPLITYLLQVHVPEALA